MRDLAHNTLHPILVVEDLDDDYDTIVEAVHQTGVHNNLVRVQTLREARALLALPDPGQFRFVLLDINLPDGPGADVVRTLRKTPALRTIPVIVFSTSENPRDLRQMYEVGVNAYHVKTIRHQENLEMLSAILDYWLRTVTVDDHPGTE